MRESDHCGDTGSRFINTHIQTDSAFRFPPDPPLQCWRARGDPDRPLRKWVFFLSRPRTLKNAFSTLKGGLGGMPFSRERFLSMGVYKSRPGKGVRGVWPDFQEFQ